MSLFGSDSADLRGILVLSLCAIAPFACMESSSDEGDTETDTSTESDGDIGSEDDSDTGSEDAGSDSETDETDETTETGDPTACWEDLEVGALEVIYEGFLAGSEGLTFDADGQLYVTTSGKVWTISPAGEATLFAEVPDALGLAARADGQLLVASIGEFSMADGGIYTVDTEGTATLLATGIDSPNFVVMAPDGSALVSDDFDTRVFRVTQGGDLSVVIEAVPSPNGMAYSPDGADFYVASTFTPDGQLTRYQVDDAGLPIPETGVEIMHLGQGSTPDGIAVDELGRVYVAANLKGQIWRVDGQATELSEGELVAGELEYPASMAFGRGPDFDPCSLYYTELIGQRVMRLVLDVHGAPLNDGA